MIKRKTENISVEKAIDMFVIEKQAKGSKSTYEADLRKFFSQFSLVNDITNYEFSKLINTMLETKKPVTVNHYLREYRAFLYWCMDNDMLYRYKIKVIKAQEAPIRLYSQEDIDKLFIKPDKEDSFPVWRTWAMVCFVLGTGARAGTLSSIKISDLNLKEHEVVYAHSKNKHAPIVPLCEALTQCLVSYMNLFQLDDYLFPNRDGSKMNTHGITQAFARFCDIRGVQYNSFHALRHTFSKQFIMNGGNCFQLQKMLDHQSLAMSEHYTHLFGSDLHGVVNDFSPLSKYVTNNNKKILKKSWNSDIFSCIVEWVVMMSCLIYYTTKR